MSRFLDKVQIYGYSEEQELVILSGLLTGTPCLLVGDIGSAKTTLVRKLGKALHGANPEYTAVIYNAAHDNFEDIIGFPNAAKLAKGKMEYISDAGTIWGKTLVGVDEINRPKSSTSSKWLDTLQDRTMMGRPTGVKFLYGMMNPLSVEGTNILGQATLGRFASFIWVPRLTEMTSGDRRAVLSCVTDTTLPGYSEWSTSHEEIKDEVDFKECGQVLIQILEQAAEHYEMLKEHGNILKNFLDEFAMAILEEMAETEEKVVIDGRRSGMLYRQILAVRAVELARANVMGLTPRAFADSVRTAVRFGLPLGVNRETGIDKDSMAKVNLVINQLIHFLDEDADHKKLKMYTELLTTQDPFRCLEMLLSEDISEVVKNSAWQRFLSMRHFNGYVIGFISMQIEAAKPGTIPPNAMDGIVGLMDRSAPVPREIDLPPSMVDFRDQVQEMLDQDSIWGQLIAANAVNETIDRISSSNMQKTDGIQTELTNTAKSLEKLVMQSKGVDEVVQKKL